VDGDRVRIPLNRLLAAALLLAGAAGCAKSGDGKGPAPRLDKATLSNAEYRIPIATVGDGGNVRARGGNWSGPQGKESLTVLDLNARGDLDGDGVPDAAVVLVYWGGGSGVFNYLAAVVNDHGTPRHVASAELGDRVRIDGLSAAGGKVTVTLTVQGPNDPMCCPTQAVTRTFALHGQELVETGKETP
jgi:hypothetical protein